MNTLISWESFSTHNQDARGIRYKFEDLCRHLFANENISDNKFFRYLHSNPNNPGLEVEPIVDERSKRRISFQAKYFDNRVGYNQILKSAKETVKNYKNEVDHVYLFCNKPLERNAQDYVKAVSVLKSANITMQPITDTEILRLVVKYPYLELFYFGNHTISHEWLVQQAEFVFAELGERFNREFNVITENLKNLFLFVQHESTLSYINQKKATLLANISRLYWMQHEQQEFLLKISKAVKELPDIEFYNLMNAFQWETHVIYEVSSEREVFYDEKRKLEEKKKEQYAFAYPEDEDVDRKDLDKAKQEYEFTCWQIDKLKELLELPHVLNVTEWERSLICGNVLIIKGSAGSGKTQLLSYAANNILAKGDYALLINAGTFLTKESVQKQIMDSLRLNYSFEELIDILEALGEKNGQIVPVFIDALNETWTSRIWKRDINRIIDKIRNSPMVKLVLAYRTEFENSLLPDNLLKNKNSDIITVVHDGFRNEGAEAIKEFLDFYNIPFTPTNYLDHEMTNPLFLTLYCKLYDGKEVSLPLLYERLIKHTNNSIHSAMWDALHDKGFTEDEDLLTPFVKELTKELVASGKKHITQTELCGLHYFTERDLAAVAFIKALGKENFLHNTQINDETIWFFAYDQMNDYYCAKYIVDSSDDKDDLRIYLTEHVLSIKDGKLGNYGDIALFIHACAFYAEKFREECIDIIDVLTEKNEQEWVITEYLNSFQWRKRVYLSYDDFIELLRTYPCNRDVVWDVLISCSVKENNRFNADFLHQLLSGYKLNQRDALWTTYINQLWDIKYDRVAQLVEMYNRGEKLVITNVKQTELLLTLFAWLLTSSNRWLRDYASKAMIEILKENFSLCEIILHKFADVDDPYVIQRLYGIVFGACCKRMLEYKTEYISLAKYVYKQIFDKEYVYPDILLRDYARLIIERFLFEYPEYKGEIDNHRIRPPYKSELIPKVDTDYSVTKFSDGMARIKFSMLFEHMGTYGDFGRYIFESALRYFDIDHAAVFNYALYYIFQVLGYKEELFGKYDRNCDNIERHITVKLERIGKKYEWITFYNVMARVCDNYKRTENISSEEKIEIPYEGSWDPYVRDFDPTLNENFMVSKIGPVFNQLEGFIKLVRKDNEKIDANSKSAQNEWLDNEGSFVCGLKDTLLLTDKTGQQWVTLGKCGNTKPENTPYEKLQIYYWLYGYFMTTDQEDEFKKCAEKGLSIISSDISYPNQTYVVFNREYPWAPSCEAVKEYSWKKAEIFTGEYHHEEIVNGINTSFLVEWLNSQKSETEEEQKEEDAVSIAVQDALVDDEITKLWQDGEADAVPNSGSKTIRSVLVKKDVGRILSTTTDLHWEGEYDATKESTVSWSVPCAELIEALKLRQLEADGFYFDRDGKLAAFDSKLIKAKAGVVIRKDLLDSFLVQRGLKLVWLGRVQKEIHNVDYTIANDSEWEAVLSYEGNAIVGKFSRMQYENN